MIKQANAFTLMEVLLAISLMVIISGFIFTWLQQSTAQIEAGGVTLTNDQAVLQAVMLMRRDIAQASAKAKVKIENDTTLRIRSRSSIDGQGLYDIQYIIKDNTLFRQQGQQTARFVCEHNAIGFEQREANDEDNTDSRFFFWWQHAGENSEPNKMALGMP